MFDLNVYVVVAALAGLLVFLRLSIAWKALVAFIIMSQGFDMVPYIVYGSQVWDFGAIMLLMAGAQLIFAKPKEPSIRAVSVTLLRVFIIWLIFCLFYSLLVYRYPAMNTLKSARQMLIGYLSIFIFLKLFRVDKNALPIFIKWLYFVTYILQIVTIVQNIVGSPILYGLSVEYIGAIRYLPVFLPISLFYLWIILSKYFQGAGIKIHEWVYGGLVFFVVATTYTRGLYIAVVVSLLTLLFLLQLGGRLKATSAVIFVSFISLGLTILIAGGLADRVINRGTSGFNILLDTQEAGSQVNVDTFSGRLGLVKERIALVIEHNPIVGFGFLHEGDVPVSLRSKFRHGSVVYTPEMVEKYRYGQPYVLALYSADIGWANIVVNTGLVGSLLFLLFVAIFLFSYKKLKIENAQLSHYRTAFFVQTITLLILMFNGNTFTNNVQIPALMIAGYLYCNAKPRSPEAPNR